MELTLFVDHQCNLRCTYCYNGEKFTKKMSRETMREAVSLAMKSARDGLDVAFFGGEPLLHPDFVEEAVAHVEAEVARLAPGMPLSFVMNTNGTLLGDEAVRVMRAPRRFTVNVSVDGPAEVHDKVRLTKGGKGSFEVVAKGLERLRAAGIPYQILSVVRPEGALRLGRTMETVFALAPRKAQLSIDYSAPWDEAAVADLRAGLAQAGEVWMKLFRAGTALPWNPVHGKILAHLHGGMPCASRCVLGNGEMTVTPSGNIYPCGQMVGEDDDPSLVIGHIDSGIDPEAVKRLMAAKERIDETCGDCGLRDRCQSHCGCRHVALSGELGKVTAVLCETEAAFIDEADRIAEIMVAEKCPAFLGYYYGQEWAPTPGAKIITLRRPSPGAHDRPPPP
jgi:uncharacterized protein